MISEFVVRNSAFQPLNLHTNCRGWKSLCNHTLLSAIYTGIEFNAYIWYQYPKMSIVYSNIEHKFTCISYNLGLSYFYDESINQITNFLTSLTKITQLNRNSSNLCSLWNNTATGVVRILVWLLYICFLHRSYFGRVFLLLFLLLS